MFLLTELWGVLDKLPMNLIKGYRALAETAILDEISERIEILAAGLENIEKNYSLPVFNFFWQDKQILTCQLFF